MHFRTDTRPPDQVITCNAPAEWLPAFAGQPVEWVHVETWVANPSAGARPCYAATDPALPRILP